MFDKTRATFVSTFDPHHPPFDVCVIDLGKRRKHKHMRASISTKLPVGSTGGLLLILIYSTMAIGS